MTLPAGTVTFLMTDVEGSTRHWEANPEAMRVALTRHEHLVIDAVERAGGAVVRHKGEGDSIFAVFVTAQAAVRAAYEAQGALTDESWPEPVPLKVRMAVHTGEAELREGDYYGPAPNRCARVRGIAHGGQVLVSGATHAIVESELPKGLGLQFLGEYVLKDVARAERVYQLTGPGLKTDFPPPRSEAAGATLPIAVTSFIGRADELAQLGEEIRRRRLVTVVGPPGAGKSRLAMEAALRLAGDFRDRVYVVDLSMLADPGLVASAIASALGVREDPAKELLTTVAEAVKADRKLLVLDGCERVIEEAARVADLLVRRSPDLHLLATGLEPLGVPGEVRWPIRDLAVADATSLFVERARMVQPSFAPPDEIRSAIEQLVLRLDCVPLAIELAAARVNVLTVAQMLDRLSDRFRLLAGGSRGNTLRHQTLRAALAWSHDLLNQAERELFRRLCIFSGGFNLASATAVAAVDGQDEFAVIDDIGRLVDKSLVAGAAESGRYRMLESIRAYGRERLADAGEMETYSGRHADHFLAIAGASERSNQAELATEIDNFRLAQEWFDGHDPEKSLRLATALAWLWTGIGKSGEGQSSLESALSRWRVQDRLRASGCFEAGWFAWWRGDGELSATRFAEAESIAHAIGDPLIEGRSLAGHATLVADIGRDDESQMAWAKDAMQRAADLLRVAGDRVGEAGALHGLGFIGVFMGDHHDGNAHLDRAIALRREIGDNEGLIYSFYWKAVDAVTTGGLETGYDYMIEALRHMQEPSRHPMIGGLLEGLAEIAARDGDYEQAVILYEVADREQETAGLNRWMPVPGWRNWLSDIQARLGEARYEMAAARGRSMSVAAALELARPQPRHPKGAAAPATE
ncbi:MAG TPA: AAA family ATPase [Candidatus Dormibacteraeota bacterium]|nr:AAA family ATPase [Candidatus Dormibacteraeota bacterium]